MRMLGTCLVRDESEMGRIRGKHQRNELRSWGYRSFRMLVDPFSILIYS